VASDNFGDKKQKPSVSIKTKGAFDLDFPIACILFMSPLIFFIFLLIYWDYQGNGGDVFGERSKNP